MLKKTIEYTNFDGVEMKEDFYFNLTQAELAELQMSQAGGFGEYINKIVAAKDVPTLAKLFKELIMLAYGEKSADGKRFIKKSPDGHRLADEFVETEAYSVLYMELVSDDKEAANFVNGILPPDVREKAQAAGNQNANHPALQHK